MQAVNFLYLGLQNQNIVKLSLIFCDRVFLSKITPIILVNFRALFAGLRENLINDYYDKNHCINNDKCFVCNKLKDVKEDYIKVKIKRLKRVKEIIKHKRMQKRLELIKCFVII